MKDLKTLIAEYNVKHNADVTHVLTGEDFVTLYAVTDAVVFVEVHQEGYEVQSLVISLAVFDKSLSRNNGSDADIKPVGEEPAPKKFNILCDTNRDDEAVTLGEYDELEEAQNMFQSIVEPAEENGWTIQKRTENYDYSTQGEDWTCVWIVSSDGAFDGSKE